MHKIAQSAGCGLAPLPRTCRARVAIAWRRAGRRSAAITAVLLRATAASRARVWRGRGYFGAVAGVAGRVPPGGGCDEDDRVKFIVKCAVIFRNFTYRREAM